MGRQASARAAMHVCTFVHHDGGGGKVSRVSHLALQRTGMLE